MTERAAFEAWWSDPAAPEGPLFTTEQHCWQAWQAATLAERERCAKVCDEWAKQNWVYKNGAIQCAAAIRKERRHDHRRTDAVCQRL
jgi:hypothetical protein